MKTRILIIATMLASVHLYAQDLSDDFRKQLGSVFTSSLSMTQALVDSDAEKTRLAAKKVQLDLSKVDMKLLKGQAHMEWMESLKSLKSSLQTIIGSTDLKVQREAFASFNNAMYKSLKSIGIKGIDTVYYQYCPMALNNQGAYWFSDVKEINNPYFGTMMLRCGSTDEVLTF